MLGKGHGVNVLQAASYPRTRDDLWIHCGITMALLDETRINILTKVPGRKIKPATSVSREERSQC